MKKLMMVMVAATLVLASCSKESKLNRKLDGSWNVVSYSVDGVDQSMTNVTMVMSFTKDKKGVGTYTNTLTVLSVPQVETGSYVLTEDATITENKITPGTGSSTSVYTVTDYSKSDLTLTQTSSGDVYVFKLKKI